MNINEIDKVEADLHRLLTKAMRIIDNADIDGLVIENTADMDRIGRVVGNCAKALSELAKRRADQRAAIDQAAQKLQVSIQNELQGRPELIEQLVEVLDTARIKN